jgi:hypothetical protein
MTPKVSALHRKLKVVGRRLDEALALDAERSVRLRRLVHSRVCTYAATVAQYRQSIERALQAIPGSYGTRRDGRLPGRFGKSEHPSVRSR